MGHFAAALKWDILQKKQLAVGAPGEVLSPAVVGDFSFGSWGRPSSGGRYGI
jgi:hypothetical protein